jgi:hypothetical protein
MNSQTRLLNLLNFQGNSSGKTENFISSGSRRAGSRTGSKSADEILRFSATVSLKIEKIQ